MSWFALFHAVLAGAMISTQAGINSILGRTLGHPLSAAVVSFAVGVIGLSVVSLASGVGLPNPAKLVDAPVWVWISGGLLGAFFVASTIVLAPKLGATLLVSAVVAGQMGSALLLDHYGLLGYPQHDVSFGRIAGVTLIAAGIILIKKF